jgi:hypothetical protein
VYLMNVSLDGFVETPGPLDRLGEVRRRALRVVHRSRARGRRLRLRPAALGGDGRLLADRRGRPGCDRADARVRPDWNATPKVLFSHELESVEHGARLVRGDVGEELAKLQREFDGEIDVGGPTLAAHFIERGLVDEYRLMVHPVVLGAGTPFFPPRCVAVRPPHDRDPAFANGAMYLGYEAVR